MAYRLFICSDILKAILKLVLHQARLKFYRASLKSTSGTFVSTLQMIDVKHFIVTLNSNVLRIFDSVVQRCICRVCTTCVLSWKVFYLTPITVTILSGNMNGADVLSKLCKMSLDILELDPFAKLFPNSLPRFPLPLVCLNALVRSSSCF